MARSVLLLIFASGVASVVAGAPSSPQLGRPRPEKKFVSSNYLQATKCFPSLAKDPLRGGFSLEVLKNEIDSKYVSLSSQKVLRQVRFKNERAQTQVLTMTQVGTPAKPQWALQLESLDAKAVKSQLPLPAKLPRISNEVQIRDFLSGKSVTFEEETFDDTKPNGHRLSYKLDGKAVTELVFRNLSVKEKLYCYLKSDVGPLCLCK